MADSASEHVRQQLKNEIMAMDQALYWYIRAGGFNEWLRIDVTMPQLKTLILVYGSQSGSMRMGQLAVALGVALSTATGIVDRLVENGLLWREEDPEDRRSIVVRLTEKGHATMEHPYRTTRRYFGAALDLLTDDDLRALARSFRVLYEASQRVVGLANDESGPALVATSDCGVSETHSTLPIESDAGAES